MTYPTNWMVASKDQQAAVEDKVRPYLNKVGNIDLNHCSAFIFNPHSGAFADNVNVVISPGMTGVDAQSQEQMRAAIAKLGEAFGSTPSNVRITTETYGNHQVMVARYGMYLYSTDLYYTQVVIPDGWQSVIVTCTCTQYDAELEWPIFKEMISTTAASIPVSSNPFSGMPSWLTGAIVGGIVGLLVALVAGGLRKAAQPPRSLYPPQSQYPSQPLYPPPGSYPPPNSDQQSRPPYQ
jgi:hypothetical protein